MCHQGNINIGIITQVKIDTNWLLNRIYFNNKTKKSSSLQHFSLKGIQLVVIIPYSDFLGAMNMVECGNEKEAESG